MLLSLTVFHVVTMPGHSVINDVHKQTIETSISQGFSV